MSDSPSVLERMRQDWDRRAREGPERFIYTRDSAADCADFDESGRANYNQLVRPYLPILLQGRPARDCVAVEIGCGVGRMTRCFAEAFGAVHALDVSSVMIEEAARRLAGFSNIRFHPVTGADLAPVADASVDLVFSYIVFQHIPSRDVIESYVWEAARALKPGGTLKVQLNGAPPGPNPPDTWHGVTYTLDQARSMLESSGFHVLSAEGEGTQYMVLTACKGEPGLRTYVLPGEPWAEEFLLDGWHPPVDGSWRPVDSTFSVSLPWSRTRCYAGIYFWPESPLQTPAVRFVMNGAHVAAAQVDSAGDHYFEIPAGGGGILQVQIVPPCGRKPAVRIIGLF